MIPYQLCQLRSWAGKTVGHCHDSKGADGGKSKTVESSLSRLQTCRIMFMSAAVKITHLCQCREAHDSLIPSIPFSFLSQRIQSHRIPCCNPNLVPPTGAGRLCDGARIYQPNRTIRLMHSSLLCLTWMGGRKVEGCHPRRPTLF